MGDNIGGNPLLDLLRSNKQAILEKRSAEPLPQPAPSGGSHLVSAYESLKERNKKAHLLTVKDLKLLEWLSGHSTVTSKGERLSGAATQKELKEKYGMSNNEYCNFVRDRLCKKLKMLRTARDSNGTGRPRTLVLLNDDVKELFSNS